MEFTIKDGVLSFQGLEAGKESEGKIRFDFDVLRQIVVKSTRFATGRKIEPRTLKELTKEITDFVATKNEILSGDEKEITKLKTDLHNAERIIESLNDRIGRLNQERNENRYMARAVQAPPETA